MQWDKQSSTISRNINRNIISLKNINLLKKGLKFRILYINVFDVLPNQLWNNKLKKSCPKRHFVPNSGWNKQVISNPKNESMSFYCILYYQLCNKSMFKLMICLLSWNTLKELLFICPSDFRASLLWCCHPCFKIKCPSLPVRMYIFFFSYLCYL